MAATPVPKTEVGTDSPFNGLFRKKEMIFRKEEDPARISKQETDLDLLNLYIEEIGKWPLLTREEETELAAEAAAGSDEAKHRLVEANLRLVVFIAKGFTGNGVALLDLIQEGNLGLMHAVDKYDHTRGVRLNTYAVYWIVHYLDAAITKYARTVRLPETKVRLIRRIKRTAWELRKRNDADPEAADVAAALGLTEELVRELQKLGMEPLSLEAPIEADDTDPYSNVFLADAELDPEEEVGKSLLKEQIRKALNMLTPRERKVLILRYGLEGRDPRTYEQIGALFAVSGERIRQIEAVAIQKLRRPECAALLRDFVK